MLDASQHLLVERNCPYLDLYTVALSVTHERQSWLIGPISPAAGRGALYQQIVDRLKREVSEGRLKPGAALPSFRQLAEDLLVSVITVKRAYEELEREGIIFRRQGLGTFVAEQGHDRSREAKLAAAKDLLREGFREAAEAGLKPAEIVRPRP
jgi:GntR family transcriptional regulator